MLHDRHWTIEDANAVLPWVADRVRRMRRARDRLESESSMATLPSVAAVTGGAWPGRENAEATLELTFGLEELGRLEHRGSRPRGRPDRLPRASATARRSTSAGWSTSPRSRTGTRSRPASRAAGRLNAASARSAPPRRGPGRPPRAAAARRALDQQRRCPASRSFFEAWPCRRVEPREAVRPPGDQEPRSPPALKRSIFAPAARPPSGSRGVTVARRARRRRARCPSRAARQAAAAGGRRTTRRRRAAALGQVDGVGRRSPRGGAARKPPPAAPRRA